MNLKTQWQSLKMGQILNKSMTTCYIFLLIWKEWYWAVLTGSLRWSRGPLHAFDVELCGEV